ncbi:MAG: O-antigen ligase family protein [Acidobacteriia bacterium]|nr:O-antigen ligase family protein [Terriglobia bacterium]
METVVADQYLEGNPLDAAIFAVLLVAGLAVLIARRRRARTLLQRNAPLLVFFCYCVLSVLWSDYPFVAFKRWIKALGDLVMVLVVMTDVEPTAAIKRLLTRPGFLLIPLSILLIRYYPSLGRAYSEWTGTPYNIGVATGKNGLGYVCLIFGLGSLWCFLEAIRDRRSGQVSRLLIAHGALLVLALWLFRMANSATSLGCFLIGGLLLVVTRTLAVARRSGVVHLMVGTVLFIILYGLILSPSADLVATVGRDSTLTGRTVLWNKALSMTVNPYFGAGYESFWLGRRLEKIWSTNWEHPNQAHNGYLEIYLDLGWIGLILLGFVMVSGYRGIVRALRWDPGASQLRLVLLVVAAIYNLTEHAFRELHPVWIVFLLAITVMPQHHIRSTREAV